MRKTRSRWRWIWESGWRDGSPRSHSRRAGRLHAESTIDRRPPRCHQVAEVGQARSRAYVMVVCWRRGREQVYVEVRIRGAARPGRSSARRRCSSWAVTRRVAGRRHRRRTRRGVRQRQGGRRGRVRLPRGRAGLPVRPASTRRTRRAARREPSARRERREAVVRELSSDQHGAHSGLGLTDCTPGRRSGPAPRSDHGAGEDMGVPRLPGASAGGRRPAGSHRLAHVVTPDGRDAQTSGSGAGRRPIGLLAPHHRDEVGGVRQQVSDQLFDRPVLARCGPGELVQR